MNHLTTDITFYSPFHVATGTPSRGFDSTINPDDPLPASSLKGVMRANAARLLGSNHPLVESTFGKAGQPSPWSWGMAKVAQHETIRRARIKLGVDGIIEDGLLMQAEVSSAPGAAFEIMQREYLDDVQRDRQVVLLSVAARAVRSIGSDRNRGYGWVKMSPQFGPVAAEAAAWVLARRAEK